MPRERIRIEGVVQGVGFRPFVWRLARELGVSGFVLNDAKGVHVEAEGPAAALDDFARRIAAEAPPLARVDAVRRSPSAASGRLEGFAIVHSGPSGARTGVAADAAICAECLAEIATPGARRHAYPFTNCTNCGPRFSIVEGIPYDRATTTMRAFALCPDCRAEYEDPADRRFHAQPLACPACGPTPWLERPAGRRLAGDPIPEAARLLAGGAIVALKGLGGFHLACDARNGEAVALLRARMRRPAKPFAVMAPDLATVAAHSACEEAAARALASPAAPIVLLPRADTPPERPLPEGIAPHQGAIGWMLPATPLHALLLEAFGGPLVMTSGNLSGEPQAIGNEEAREKLSAFADAFLMHDRAIARRLDDPVVRLAAGAPRVIRRGRGLAPSPIPLPEGVRDGPAVTAFGGQMKSAICLTRGSEAILSHHLGDLETALAVAAFKDADRDYHALFEHAPEMIACDLHPDYVATRHGEARAQALGVPFVSVQHHHAHVASCMAGAGWRVEDGPVVGIALDGLGLGTDGTIWGGEVLVCDYREAERHAFLRPVPLPGGPAAQREPWRNLLAQLDAAGLDAGPLLADKPLAPLRAMMEKGLNAPLSSSAGRLYDAVAAALGLCTDRQTFEAEAAMRLEAVASRAGPVRPYPFARDGAAIHPAPLWRALLADLEVRQDVASCAARFEAGLAAAFAGRAREAMRASGARAVALTGGCFQNAGLLARCLAALGDVTVLTHTDVPAGDGGLALGQAVIAAARCR